MKIHEFFSKYANTPLSKRFVPLNFNEGGMQTLHDIYEELNSLEKSIQPTVIREEELLRRAEKGFENLEKGDNS